MRIAHLADYSHLRKIVTRTQKVGYAGPAVSFKICKGVRYRAGLFDVGKTTSTTIDTIDEGIFISQIKESHSSVIQKISRIQYLK